MENDNTIWTPSNIVAFTLAFIALVAIVSFCVSRLIKNIKKKKHLKTVSRNNAIMIRKHMGKVQIGESKKKVWIELSNLCFALLDDYCRDEEEVVWIMNKKVWPIIDDMAYQDQKKAISDLKILGGSTDSKVFPFKKEQWHKEYVKAKKFMM